MEAEVGEEFGQMGDQIVAGDDGGGRDVRAGLRLFRQKAVEGPFAVRFHGLGRAANEVGRIE